MKLWFVFISVLTSIASADPTAALPTVETKTLNEKEFKFPNDLPHHSTWLVVGFSRDSQTATKTCYETLEKDFPGQGFTAAMLQGAPFFIKGAIVSSIRKSTPDAIKDRYLVFNDGKDELKQLAGFSSASENDAFVIGFKFLSPGKFEVVFRYHGDCRAPRYTEELKSQIQKL